MLTNFSRSRILVTACVALAGIAIVDLYFEGIQLAPLVTIPLLLIAYYASLRTAIVLAALAAVLFGAIDYSPIVGSRIDVVSFPVDTAILALAFCAAVVTAEMLQRAGKKQAQLHVLARTDRLTGLMNRHAFDEALAEAFDGARAGNGHVAILFIDLDGFKSVNDTYGHEVGDEVLRVAAKRLAGAVRADDVLARVGGDEFAILVRGGPAGDASAHQIAQNVEVAFDAPIVHRGRTVSLSTSIGLARSPDDGLEPAALLRLADKRMYERKAARKARIAP